MVSENTPFYSEITGTQGGWTPLMYATEFNYSNIAQFLSENQAELDAQNEVWLLHMMSDDVIYRAICLYIGKSECSASSLSPWLRQDSPDTIGSWSKSRYPRPST